MHESRRASPRTSRALLSALAAAALGVVPCSALALAAWQDGPPPSQGERQEPRPEGGGRRGGPPGGPGQRPEKKLVAQFDLDKDGRLGREERAAARAFLREEALKNPAPEGPGGPGGPGGFGPGGFGGPGGRGGPPGGPGMGRRNLAPPTPGAKVAPADVKQFPEAGLYDPSVLRTFFLEFEIADWEKELVDFHNTDVEVPAKLAFDGRTLTGVGVRFRGASSYFMIGDGYKRSLNVSVDFTDKKQRALGAKTLNLLNSNGDPSFLHAVLYSHIARQYLPAPDVNLVKLVINGENWGVYANAEQFNKDFLAKWFKSAKGVRWKVPGSPRGGGGLVYQGDDVAAYQRQYEIKTEDAADAKRGWQALVKLCRTLGETPAAELESALASQLDVDGVLRFLALENATMNSDGYWIRASDFGLFLDEHGVFHVVPHDMNECFQPAGGPGMGRRGPGAPGAGAPGAGRGGPPGGGGFPPEGGPGGPGDPGGARAPREGGVANVDPLAGTDDPEKPLLSRLLAVPALRERYLGYVADIAERWFDWQALEPVVARYRTLIEAEVAGDTRKLDSTEAFRRAVGLEPATASAGEGGPRSAPSLQAFLEQRRAFLLAHPEIAKLRAGAKR